MLPITLVLLVVTSVFAAPSVTVTQYNVNDIPPVADNGKPSSSIENAFDVLSDGGDTNIYILTIRQILNDLANQSDPKSQALAVGQAIAILGELVYGNPGDACAAAELVNAYTSGNKAATRVALINFIQSLVANIDAFVQLILNPNSVRYGSGRRGNCVGGGRSYNFEAAWDSVQSDADPFLSSLYNEEYCAAKRLYNAFNIRSNNVGAAATAASLSPVTEIVQRAYAALVNLLGAIGNNGNVIGAAATAKVELKRAIV
ncbi:PREDICTED: fibroin light chain-like [Papilio polytes]|uniref:fibroin light chain-like n=1 Tax=Papilio polytes TaxID=76194 RepID=UPI000676207E|nr:PREDICTED: fibroin light chain-like [Papilio polytes]